MQYQIRAGDQERQAQQGELKTAFNHRDLNTAKISQSHPNAFNGLEEVLENRGTRSKALANGHKAYKMAEQSGHADWRDPRHRISTALEASIYHDLRSSFGQGIQTDY